MLTKVSHAGPRGLYNFLASTSCRIVLSRTSPAINCFKRTFSSCSCRSLAEPSLPPAQGTASSNNRTSAPRFSPADQSGIGTPPRLPQDRYDLLRRRHFRLTANLPSYSFDFAGNSLSDWIKNPRVAHIDPGLHECRYLTSIALLNMNNTAVQKMYVFPYMDRKWTFSRHRGSMFC
jgi:hypothetical protein